MDRVDDLPDDIKSIVRRAIQRCKLVKAFKRTSTPVGEVYVFPSPNGGICWGINSNEDGTNIKRGVEFQ